MNDNIVGGVAIATVVTLMLVAVSIVVLFEDADGYNANWAAHPSWSALTFTTARESTEGFTDFRVKFQCDQNFDIGFVGPWPDNVIEWHTVAAGEGEVILPIQNIPAVWSFRISREGHDHSRGNPADLNVVLYAVEMVEFEEAPEPDPDPIPEPEPGDPPPPGTVVRSIGVYEERINRSTEPWGWTIRCGEGIAMWFNPNDHDDPWNGTMFRLDFGPCPEGI